MTVSTLISLLQKVEHKEAEVCLENAEVYDNVLKGVVIEHNLMNDFIAVILKKE